ncbi:helix-turn-helix domain-containing protein [Sodalis ligni]|uniref:helix-turn-helix domain-containing protein n=2 Tax=Sodalis ligni TaxID=2697027 RepID=UPI002097A8B7|nr:helix-turn-helix transcriptional regulator [Sodalis ligni]
MIKHRHHRAGMARNKQDDATGMPNELDFGARMKTMRQERAWTLEQLAEKSGLSISTLSTIEDGQVSASFDTILNIVHLPDAAAAF